MDPTDEPPRGRVAYDAAEGASLLWHDLWKTMENDLPSLAAGPYPSYLKVKAFESRIRRELERAFSAGVTSRRA